MKLLVFLLIIPAFAHAFCEEYTRFAQPLKVCWKNELKAFVNAKCESDCLAKKFLAAKNQKPKLILEGGKNPAAAYCEYYNLKVSVLKDPRGAGQSFCEFSDGSLIDSNAIARGLK